MFFHLCINCIWNVVKLNLFKESFISFSSLNPQNSNDDDDFKVGWNLHIWSKKSNDWGYNSFWISPLDHDTRVQSFMAPCALCFLFYGTSTFKFSSRADPSLGSHDVRCLFVFQVPMWTHTLIRDTWSICKTTREKLKCSKGPSTFPRRESKCVSAQFFNEFLGESSRSIFFRFIADHLGWSFNHRYSH